MLEDVAPLKVSLLKWVEKENPSHLLCFHIEGDVKCGRGCTKMSSELDATSDTLAMSISELSLYQHNLLIFPNFKFGVMRVKNQ